MEVLEGVEGGSFWPPFYGELSRHFAVEGCSKKVITEIMEVITEIAKVIAEIAKWPRKGVIFDPISTESLVAINT